MRAGGFQFCKRVLSVCLSVLNKSTPLLDWFDASLLSNLLVLSEPCSKDDANDSIEGKALTISSSRHDDDDDDEEEEEEEKEQCALVGVVGVLGRLRPLSPAPATTNGARSLIALEAPFFIRGSKDWPLLRACRFGGSEELFLRVFSELGVTCTRP